MNISLRHIQHLCRTGKIEGAVKRAGSWFIPSDTSVPIKNTKSNTSGFNFVGTKNKIFNCAIELFMLKGLEAVSLRDIADKVGIQQSTIYNHFKSKQEILDTIYDFYCYYHLKDRPSLEEMDDVLKKGNLREVITHIRYNYKDDYRERLSSITKIILQRISIDDRANQIGKTLLIDEGIKYVEDVLNRGISNGTFAPFDTHATAVFINSVRIFTLFNWVADPSMENLVKLLKDESDLYDYAVKFLTDKNSE